MDLKKYIANIEDFPKKGIIFRDVTPIMQHKEAYQRVTELISDYAKSKNVDYIVGPEARGFMFGCPVATKLNIGFIPVRKPGKLPREVITEDYQLEYGTNTLAMHSDALKKGDKVVIVDDLLATGGTALATAHLCEKLGAEVVGIAFIVDLIDLKGREVLKDYDVFTILEFEGE